MDCFATGFVNRCASMLNEETELIAQLFAQAIPEIAAGIVEIKAIARRPGLRAKVAVLSHDPHVDCIGACVGVRGRRIKKIVDQLNGERIDLVRWSDAPEQLIAGALQPAAIQKVILHPAEHRAVVVVNEDHISLVEGRQGVNHDLASRLCGWQIQAKIP
jgi:N utilization substance protein A